MAQQLYQVLHSIIRINQKLDLFIFLIQLKRYKNQLLHIIIILYLLVLVKTVNLDQSVNMHFKVVQPYLEYKYIKSLILVKEHLWDVLL